MKNRLFLFVVLCLTTFPVAGQKRQPAVKLAPRKSAVAARAAPTEISGKDWDALIDSLDKEDWTRAANLSSLSIAGLKTDNDKKQLARLRYFYLYALAGKFAAGATTFAALEKAADGFLGKEFLMPSREILADCRNKINYICASKAGDRVLRVTATDKAATIHSFEYVRLAENFDAAPNSGKSAVLRGTLEKVEYNLTKTGNRIIRLIFENGFVNIVPGQ